jgi:putative FmdB family regulatory protein
LAAPGRWDIKGAFPGPREEIKALPTYDYQCQKCNFEFEREQRITEDPIKTCPKCKSRRAKRLLSASNFILKGGGWYADGYGSPGKKSEEGGGADKSSSDDSPSKKDDSKSKTKSKDSSSESSSGKSDKSGKKSGGESRKGKAE